METKVHKKYLLFQRKKGHKNISRRINKNADRKV